MVLQQAETDGYSVFAVTQVDPFAPLGLPRTVADQIASTLPEPTSSNPRPPSNRPLAQTSMHEGRIEGLEDEDYELQAALQASLMGDQFGASDPGPPAPPRLTRSFAPLPPDDSELFEQSSSRPPAATRAPADDEEDQDMDEEGEEQLDPEHGDVDPVAASMARSRLMLQRMTAHQEYAQRELWGEGSLSEADAAALEARRAERQREEQEEAEELRRAIAESEALARVEGHAPRTDDDDEESDVMNVDRPGPDPLQGFHPAGGRGVGDRVYDDDDADLQAALKASLEHVPQGWEFPELPSQPAPSHPTSVPVRVAPDPTTQTESDKDTEGAESVLSTEGEVQDHPSSNAPVDDVSVDELRRRRLARFGM
ncbi:hypothetical protein DXG01_003885 [Tephrocybe rancida]|nr:hypothetical protein DXG01_003885 [Tephrocybe rancida]